ncbi:MULTISPECIES: adenine deaminase C-terminal domain-containing protein [Paenibacillus]|uniref:adenine deaminase C-terminal domain-containing protein n=1 Tax=Paenibacillus TaxID=44249 RepID=UPI00031114DE|nr:MULTISPECIES: adenine deaminase C-terminal domain-containing protein [Paenibacillus]KAF6587163.1 amidohydrolase family protein [Paenibacillus sp. EKM211P]KKD52295.1 adenine deaminase [Paenibacillus sp. ICGEB2008]PNQ87479.1 adenosine deaminase [Paenibacillus polymyxa]SEJ29924.1 adenine deaminase [Paenibacillus polymyxa]
MRADKMILQVKVYNSYYKTFEEGNVAILDGKFMYIGQRGLESFEAAEIVEGHGKYMIPGLIDIHLHIESTMVTPATFSYGLIRNGVTTIVPEPHEMANVFGLEGIQEMMEASKDCVADMFYGIPSSVPATPLETSGGEIDIPEIDALLQTGEMICLGEIMNYVDVIRDPESKTNRILRHVREHYPELIIEGHTPQLLDLDLHQLIYAGIGSDHTHQSIEGMKARMAAGMFIEIQEKSMTPEVMDYLIQEDVAQHFCFVTDDVMPDSFVERGHLNHIVSKAIGMGMKPEDAIYAATYTPAARMRMHDRGTIAPGKIADFVLLSDLEQFDVEQVYKDGLKVFDKFEEYHQAPVKSCFPAHFYQSVKLNPLTEQDFTVKLDVADGAHPCRIMMVKDGSTFTSERIAPAQVEQGELVWEHGEHGLIATFERYGKNGNRAYGLIGGDTIKRGAVATTYSHDNHNLLVVGHNKQDMILAANTVLSSQGGFCVVENGKVLSHLPLTVGGILTEGPLEMVAAHVKELRSALLSLGYRHYNPIMSLSTHSLPVSPALKITDHGLIDVNAGKVVSLIVEPSEI